MQAARKVFQVGQLPHDDPRYIRWRKSLSKRPAPWSKGYTKETHPSVAKISFTFKKNKIDNFKQWRAEARKQGLIPSGYPEFRRTKSLAFLMGMVLGDGSIYEFPRTEGLRIALGTDKPELWKYVAKIVEEIFKKRPYVYKQKRVNCMIISIYQKEISKRLGIPRGDRGSVNLFVPTWIKRRKSMLVAYLKGLYEAEGGFHVHKPTSTYKLIFYNSNGTLLSIVENALQYLGFHPHRSKHKIQLSREKEVYKLKTLLSFRKYGKL